MSMQLTYEGGCSCRKLRFRMSGEPLIVHACHCRQCQKVTGGAFVLNALIEKDNLEHLSGDIESTLFPDTYHRAFYCPVCATYVWSEYRSGRFDDCWFVRVGVLDEPDRFPPSVHIFTESKQPWLNISGDKPIFEKFYRIADVWSDESIARMGSSWRPPE